MRAVIQRVSRASVSVDDAVVSSIHQGLLILLGVEHEDIETDMDWLIKKILHLRIFNDKDQKMNLSVGDIHGEILVISQFTLHASTKKGNRPSYIRAAKPEIAERAYNRFLEKLRHEFGKDVGAGIFGAMMEVSLVNDGPVTIIIDSKTRE